MTQPVQFPARQQRGLAKLAKLSLDFTINNTLDPRITFSRTSNATVVGPDGLIQYAPHNLLTYSEQFDNAAWGKSACTIFANAIGSPDGTSTSDKLVESTTTAEHLAWASRTGSNETVTFSIYAKPAGRTNIRIGFSNFATDGRGAVFNLSTGVVVSVDANGTDYTNLSASIFPAADGYYRCTITVTKGAVNTTNNPFIEPAVGTTFTYTGDGTSGIYLWGAQLNEGALQPYYSTTVKNLLGYSQNFENSAWSKNNTSIAASTVIGPFGFDGGQKLVEDAVSGTYYISESNVVNAGVPYTISVYAKESQQTPKRYLALVFSSVLFGSTIRATFDLSAGTYVATNSPDSASITPIGNGWYRCQVSATCVTSGTTSTQIRLATTYPISLSPYTGDGTSGIYIFGAQISDSASLDPYSYNPVAAPTSTAYYGPRFDYDPVTLAPKGLLIEEQRTNYIRNNTMVGAVNGVIDSGGAFPTNWAAAGVVSGLTVNVVGSGSDKGVNYVDLRFSGTSSVTTTGIYFESNSSIAASVGQNWTSSFYAAVVGGSKSNISSIRSAIVSRNSSSITLATSQQNIGASATLDRFSHTYTTDVVGTVFIQSGFLINMPSSGLTIDITLRIGLPQLELGAFATSVIPTTSAQVTRAADNALMVGSNFSSWYNQSEGTVFAKADVFSTSNNIQIIQISDGTNNNRNQLFGEINAAISWYSTVGGTNTMWMSAGNRLANTLFKIAGAIASNNGAFSLNGGNVVTDNTVTVPTNLTMMSIGCYFSGTSQLNGHIQSIKYYPTRLPNGILQGLTA